MKSLRVRSVAAAAVAVALSAASLSALAAENGLQRYSPGVGGSDMTAPLVPGWYFQLPFVGYHASKAKGNDGKITTTAGSTVEAKATNMAFLPRLTYLSTDQFFGGNLGVTAMLPLVHRKAEFVSQSPSVVVQGLVAAQNGIDNGVGDAEISPIVHWELSDSQTVTLAPTVVIPTGDYKATQRVNAGYGNFYTFRPSVQYAFIGDGWDVGARAVLSFNTRNKDTGYLSGKIFNLDYQLMKFVSEDIRVGLQGYFVRQLSADNYDAGKAAFPNPRTTIVDGNKMSVNAAGPAVSWIKNGGEMMVEGKVLREYNARNRFEGTAFWLTLSKPL
ncbi:MAG: hypothetical protein RI907_3653 [Pseudomonadota bacterium]|jgi:hypothetical protein